MLPPVLTGGIFISENEYGTLFSHKMQKGKRVLIIYNEKYSDFNSMMARYEEEMRRLYKNSPQNGGTGEPAAEPEDKSLEQKLENRQSLPQEIRKEVLGSLPTEENVSPEKTEIHRPEDYAYVTNGEQGMNPENDKGKIIVTATSGREAYPLQGVRVVIDKECPNDGVGRLELVGILFTDNCGRTEPLTVETVNRSLSQEPGEKGETFTTYYVSARKDGYFPIDKYPVDVFGGQTSILELGLTPLPEDFEGGN